MAQESVQTNKHRKKVSDLAMGNYKNQKLQETFTFTSVPRS